MRRCFSFSRYGLATAEADNPPGPVVARAVSESARAGLQDDVLLRVPARAATSDVSGAFGSRAPAPVPAAPACPGWALFAQLVARCSRILAGCQAQEIARFYALRSVAAWVREARAALSDMRSLAKVADRVERMESDLACPLHQGLLETPAALHCGHVFEAAWLARVRPTAVVQDDSGDDEPALEGEAVHCPTCRAPGVPMPVPAALTAMLSELRAFHARAGRPAEPTLAPPADPGSSSDDEEDRMQFDGLVAGPLAELAAAFTAERNLAAAAPPLFQAVRSGQVDFVENVLAASDEAVDLNFRTPLGRTALHCAASWGYLDVARYLLHLGADADISDGNEVTPIYSAVSRGEPAMVALLLEYGADPNPDGESMAMGEAIAMGYVDIARSLLAAGAPLAVEADEDVLHGAIVSRTPGIVALVLAAGCPLRTKMEGRTVLDCVTDPEHGALVPEIIDLVLAAYGRADPTAREDFAAPLCAAVRRQDADIIAKLLDAGADVHQPDADGETPLTLAAGNAALSALLKTPRTPPVCPAPPASPSA